MPRLDEQRPPIWEFSTGEDRVTFENGNEVSDSDRRKGQVEIHPPFSQLGFGCRYWTTAVAAGILLPTGAAVS